MSTRAKTHLLAAVCALASCGRTPPARPTEPAAPAPQKPAVAPPRASAPGDDAALDDRAPAAIAPSPYPPAIGPNVIERGRGIARRADTEAECRACNGTWGPHGLVGAVGCLCGTSDAGKACVSPLDCEAECIVDDAGSYAGVRCGPGGCNGPEPRGHCAALVTSFGCHGRIAEMPVDGGVVREVHVLCLD